MLIRRSSISSLGAVPVRPPIRPLASRRDLLPALRAVNAAELLDGLAALPGTQDAGGDGNGIVASRLVNGVEYARSSAVDEPRLRGAFKRRQGGGATPLVVVSDDPEQDGFLRVLGPQRDGPLRRVRAESLLGLAEKTLTVRRLQAVRLLAEELDRLDDERIAGLRVRGLGTEHLYGERLPGSPRWADLESIVDGVNRSGWRELLSDLGYSFEALQPQGYLAKAGGRPTLVVHPRAQAWLFARLDDQGRLPEGALLADCRAHGAAYGVLAAGTRLRLLAAGTDEAGAATRYLELDAAALEPRMRPLLGLLSPAYLADGGFRDVLADARDHGQQLRRRLDRVLRQEVLPVLGRELGTWAKADGRDLADDRAREEVESAALLFVFRVLFLLYAESAGYLPMANPTYRGKSLTRVAERAFEERDVADPVAAALWEDVAALVRRMRTGHTAWELPAYNGDLFAADAVAGAAALESASIPDAALGPALVALARDPDDREVGVDFSGLEVGHLGYIYEGLLSLRLSLADADVAYDAAADRYVVPGEGQTVDVCAGELLWLTNEGGRKGGGVYYTRTELVRHLVRGAVGPAFDRHLDAVRDLAARDPAAAAELLFDFRVLDPACGSAHFLVEVIDELADKVAQLLGEVALPGVREQLDGLRARAGSFGAGIEDTALLKRLVLKRCVYGVDLSAMGVEIAKVSLWLSTFVPGLSLAYLDHNVQRGNSLIGVARADEVAAGTLFGDAVSEAIADAAAAAAALSRIDDTTPEQVAASRAADVALHERIAGAKRLFDLWTAEPLGLAGARDEAERLGADVLAGRPTLLAAEAEALAGSEHALHWPLAFAEVFARERPGFDAVVGNPPWDEVTIEELAFYARYRPGLRALAEGPRRVALADLLLERPDLPEALAATQAHSARLRRYFKDSGSYAGSPGDPDVYKFFCQRYRSLLAAGGVLGVVLPRGALVLLGSAGFRRWLFSTATPMRIDTLVNRRLWAFDIHPQYTVALVVAANRLSGPDVRFTLAGVAASLDEFTAQVESEGIALAVDSLGADLELPLLGTQAQAAVLARLRSTGHGFSRGAGRWACFQIRELRETEHHGLWAGATEGWPLWKGESFDQYDAHGSEARTCPTSDAVWKVVHKPNPGSNTDLRDDFDLASRRATVVATVGRARVAYRRVTRGTDSRTVIASLVPPEVFLAYSGPYLAFADGMEREQAACLGIMNSLAFDWQARRYVELSMSMTTLESLRLPALDTSTFDAVAHAAARLSCPDERFADFAAAAGVEVGPLAPAERDALRAEIDAHVARAWDLTAQELEVVFADFTLDAVPADYRELVRARFAELG